MSVLLRIAVLGLALAAGLGWVFVLVRQAFLRWEARRVWKRYERERRAHYESCRFVEDKCDEPIDVEFEEVKR